MEQEYKYMVATRCFTFNHAPYIEDALRGFAMQETTFPVVTIIVDDASTDGEPEVIRKYLAEHFQSPYRVEETEYANIICAKHKTNANCDFVVFLLKYNHYSIKKPKLPYLSEWNDKAKYHALCEGDDYWIDPLKLQKQVDFMEDNLGYTLCCHNAYKYYVQDDCRAPFCKSKKERDLSPYDAVHKWIIATASMLYRREMETRPDWEERIYSGDYSLILRCLYNGKIHYLKEIMSVYRFNTKGGSMTAMVQGKPYFVFEQHIKLLNSFLNAPDQKYGRVIKMRIRYLKNEIDFNRTKNPSNPKAALEHFYYGYKKFCYNILFPVFL